MIARLKGLDPSTEKDLQQIHPGHSVADEMDDPFDQLLDNANMVVAAPAGSGRSSKR